MFRVVLILVAVGVVVGPVQACDDCADLVRIPAGSFVMGSPVDEAQRESWQAGTESPAHTVRMPRPFALAATAVTVAEFRRFVVDTAHDMRGGCHIFDGTEWRLDPAASWQAPGFEQAPDHPAVCLSWHDALAYVDWLSANRRPGSPPFRLPSEAEREYATRAGTATPFWWGPTITPGEASYDTREVYAGNGTPAPYLGRTVPVRAFAANPWGLYGVHGGVWEWAADCYIASHDGKPEDLLADGSIPRSDRGCDRRVLRGGAFNRRPETLRSAYRTGLDPAFRGHSIGFRIAQ